MSVFVNRTLNLKSIKAIGFDMDHTIIRYHSENLEKLSYDQSIKKLIQSGYPEVIKSLVFNYNFCIRGLVLDKARGNIIKLSLFSKVKKAYHGTNELSFSDTKAIYKGLSIDLNDQNYYPIDTIFSISHGVLFAQLVTLKDQMPELFPQSYKELEEDVLRVIDLCHRDGSIKNEVVANLDTYIVKDEKIVTALERLKSSGKYLWLITNSDYKYTKVIMDYAFNPFLKNSSSWNNLFDVVVTFSRKPYFFTNPKQTFLQVDPTSGLMSNTEGPYRNEIFQFGNANELEREFKIAGDQILYLGDHIYGDILTLKKACNWRTGLIIEELALEVTALKNSRSLRDELNHLMTQKNKLEEKLNSNLDSKVSPNDNNTLHEQIDSLDAQMKKLIVEINAFFNPYWGEMMRAGAEISRFAGQVEKYACIYMSKVSDLDHYSPRTYFRPPQKHLPHDLD